MARETVFELVDLMAAGEAAGAIELLQTTLDGPVDPEQAMRGLVNHLRYVCLLQQGARPRDEWAFAPEEVARLQAQANQLSDAQVVRGLDLLADAQVRIRHGGADPRLQLELVAARLSRPALDASAQALAARVEALEAGRPAAPRPAAAAPPPPPSRPRPTRGPEPVAPPPDVADEAPSPAEEPRPRSPRAGARRAAAHGAGARRPGALHAAVEPDPRRAGAGGPAHARGSWTARARRGSTSRRSRSPSPARCGRACWGPATTGSACAPP